MMVCNECHETDKNLINCNKNLQKEHQSIHKSFCEICHRFAILYLCIAYKNYIQKETVKIKN